MFFTHPLPKVTAQGRQRGHRGLPELPGRVLVATKPKQGGDRRGQEAPTRKNSSWWRLRSPPLLPAGWVQAGEAKRSRALRNPSLWASPVPGAAAGASKASQPPSPWGREPIRVGVCPVLGSSGVRRWLQMPDPSGTGLGGQQAPAQTSTDQCHAPAATRGEAGPRPHHLPPLLGQLLGNGHPPGQRISPSPVSLGLYLAGFAQRDIASPVCIQLWWRPQPPPGRCHHLCVGPAKPTAFWGLRAGYQAPAPLRSSVGDPANPTELRGFLWACRRLHL